MGILPFGSQEEWLEQLREHDPEAYERWKQGQRHSRLQKLKEKHYAEWLAESTSEELSTELSGLEARRKELIDARLELKGQERSPLLRAFGPVERQFDEVNYKIDAVTSELIKRGQRPRSGKASVASSTHALDSHPDIAKRRAIVRQNPEARSQGLCQLFDYHNVPPPSGWVETTWTQAHRNAKRRKQIQVIISKDKKRSA